jgi:hypothetical protein
MRWYVKPQTHSQVTHLVWSGWCRRWAFCDFDRAPLSLDDDLLGATALRVHIPPFVLWRDSVSEQELWWKWRITNAKQKALSYLEVDIAAQPQYIAQLRVLLNESPLADAEPGRGTRVRGARDKGTRPKR